jgi:hypothetical protein
MNICKTEDPLFKTIEPGRQVACHLHAQVEGQSADSAL